MSLKTIRDSFHTQSLNVRNIHRLLHSDDFAIAYGNATKNEKERISKNIIHFDKNNIRKFIRKQ
ncbi:hypothetical protein LCGC14_3105880, partial [marine sediment metagenome]